MWFGFGRVRQDAGKLDLVRQGLGLSSGVALFLVSPKGSSARPLFSPQSSSRAWPAFVAAQTAPTQTFCPIRTGGSSVGGGQAQNSGYVCLIDPPAGVARAACARGPPAPGGLPVQEGQEAGLLSTRAGRWTDEAVGGAARRSVCT